MAEKQEKEENNNEDLAPAADMADDLTPEKINDFSLFAMVSFLEFWKELNEEFDSIIETYRDKTEPNPKN